MSGSSRIPLRIRLGLLALAAGGAGFLWDRHAAHPAGVSPAAADAQATSRVIQRAPGWTWPEHAPALPNTAPLTPAEVRARVMNHPSFQHSVATGSWCITHGRLRPCYGLRQRFEYHLLAIGILPVDDIRRLVEDDARQAHGAALAAAIMKVWDDYRAVRTYVPQHAFDPQDATTWQPVFEELRLARRRLMGPAWADAFFGQEESDFRAHTRDRAPGLAPLADTFADEGAPIPPLSAGQSAEAVYAERAARYGRAAADRLASLDEEWADWERRLEAAKAERSRLAQQPELSALQRDQALQAYIQSHFKPDEIRRVHALLHL